MASLAEVLGAIASGSHSSREYTERLLERIRSRDDQVRAFVRVDYGRARALATACDESRLRRERLGALHGLPVGVKDVFDTADLPTEMGLGLPMDDRPRRNAAIVARLIAAGGFVLGKTETTEAAYLTPTTTRNPWNLLHTPGGSSSGSAAAVAAGMVHATIGTQTNGSVIRPAAFCGVVGFKPTTGLLPMDGGFRFSPTLDQVGTFTRTVDDAVRLVNGLVEPGASLDEHEIDAPRLAVIHEFPWTTLAPEGRANLDQVCKLLAAHGARLHTVTLPPAFDDANFVHRAIMLHEGSRELRGLQERHRPHLSDLLNQGLDEGRRISPATCGEMLARRARLIEIAREPFESADAILCPPAPGTAPRGLDSTGDPGFCTLWSLIGAPALVLPSGVGPNGLPLGVQLVSGPRADARLIACAKWIEALLRRRVHRKARS